MPRTGLRGHYGKASGLAISRPSRHRRPRGQGDRAAGRGRRGHRRAGAPEDGPHDDLHGRRGRPTARTSSSATRRSWPRSGGSAWPRPTSCCPACSSRCASTWPASSARPEPWPAKSSKRRSPGEGSVWPYPRRTARERWAIGHPSFGTRRRGPNGEKWFTKRAAQQALRDDAGRRLARRAGRPEQAAARRVPRRVGRRAAPGAVDDRQLPQEHPAAHRPGARHGAAGRADHGADRPAVPRARARRPRRPPPGRGPVAAHRPLHPHDPERRARRRGEDPAPGAQPGRRRLAAHGEAGEGAGDAPVDGRPARRVPGLGARARAG